jgi:hypothetical protein
MIKFSESWRLFNACCFSPRLKRGGFPILTEQIMDKEKCLNGNNAKLLSCSPSLRFFELIEHMENSAPCTCFT